MIWSAECIPVQNRQGRISSPGYSDMAAFVFRGMRFLKSQALNIMASAICPASSLMRNEIAPPWEQWHVNRDPVSPQTWDGHVSHPWKLPTVSLWRCLGMVSIWGHSVHVFVVSGVLVRVGGKLWESLNEVYVGGRGTMSSRGWSRISGEAWVVEGFPDLSQHGTEYFLWSSSNANQFPKNPFTKLPRAALGSGQAMSCTRAPGWGPRGRNSSQFHSPTETPAQAASWRWACLF